MGASDPVSVPRWVLVAGSGLLASSLLALAFVAGRASAPEPLSSPAPAPASPSPAPAAVATASPAATPPPASPPEAAAPAPPPSAPDTDASAVRVYLTSLEAALTTSAAGGDPDAMAQAIVADAMSGSTAGIDTLLANTEDARARAAALTPPPPAADLHRQTLALLDDTLVVYGELRAGIASRDLASLSQLQPRAARLSRKALEVDAETERLKAAYP